MIKQIVGLAISLFLVTGIVKSQEKQHSSRDSNPVSTRHSIIGKVYDPVQNAPIEYANIILFKQMDGIQVTGTITNPQGNFNINNIRPGDYFMEIRFMGYKIKRVDGIQVRSPEITINLGTIPMEQTVLTMADIAVAADKPGLTYEIDKKVINVDQMQTAISGTAVEVLENIPSVTVDIEGNVSLRGSSNFMVLIDGRPTVLESSDALQQIPASTIDNIEIITNPSAKYDPDGTSGIINVILKKNHRTGRSGLMNLNGGMNDRYGGDFLLESKNTRFGAILGIDYSNHYFLGTNTEKNQTTREGLTSFIYSAGASRRGQRSSGFRTALEFYLHPEDLLSIDARYGTRTSQSRSNQAYDQWNDDETLHSFYTSTNEEQRSGDYYSVNLSHLHKFAAKGHQIFSQIHYSQRAANEETTNELLTGDAIKVSGRKATEAGPAAELQTKIDYTLPLPQDNKFEAGYQGEFDRSQDNTSLYDFEPETKIYQFSSQFAHSTRYHHDTHSLYAIYSGKQNHLGFQAGLRGEYTNRMVELKREKSQFTLDSWDYFPTIHLSYQFSDGKQMMTSYTRRIDRPRSHYLEPFETWMDAYNVRKGNPSLKPEYINSYEIGYQTYFGKNLFSTELYYRVNHNKVDRIRSVYDANITLHSVENVGQDYAFGTELMLNVDLTKKWNVNVMGNLYNYRIEGNLYNRPFSRESFNWSARLNNVVKVNRMTQIQLNGRYNSPTVSSQGRRTGYFTTDVAFKHDLFDKALSLTLQVRDLFRQAKYEFASEGPNFYIYNQYTREAPVVLVNVKYNMNNYKSERDRNDRRTGMEDEDEF